MLNPKFKTKVLPRMTNDFILGGADKDDYTYTMNLEKFKLTVLRGMVERMVINQNPYFNSQSEIEQLVSYRDSLRQRMGLHKVPEEIATTIG